MDSSHTAPPPAGSHPLGTSLRRSTTDRMLLGLCGGVARALDVNPTAVRLATLLLGITLLPAAVLAYLVTAVILPADDGTVLIGRGERRSRDVTAALLLTFVGAPLVIGAGAAWGLTSGPLIWPLLLLGAGAAIGVAAYRPASDASQPAVTAIQPPLAADPPAYEPTEAPTFVKPGTQPSPNEPTSGHDPQPVGPQPPRRRGLALPVISAMALIPAVFAVLFAVGAVDGGWSTWAVMLAVLALTAAAGAVAIALLRPSYLGAALLVILAALLGTSSIALSQVGPLLDDGVGERVYRPESAADLRPVYVHGIGALDLDLRDLDLRPGSRTPIRAQVGFGEVRVAVPRGVRVVAAANSPLTGVTTSARRNGAAASASASAPTIVLDVAMRAGDVQLLSGNSSGLDDLEVLADQSTGFWDPNGTDRFDALRDLPTTPRTPLEPATP